MFTKSVLKYLISLFYIVVLIIYDIIESTKKNFHIKNKRIWYLRTGKGGKTDGNIQIC